MRFLHTADWHLGKVVHQKSMIDDQSYILDQLLEIIQKEEIKVLVIAGDIYDRFIPSVEAMKVLDQFLSKAISDFKLTIFMIAGNHDQGSRLDFVSNIVDASGLYIAGSATKECKKITLSDEFGPLNFYLLPFFKPSFAKYECEADDVVDFNSAMKQYLSLQDIDYSQRNVLITHQFVAGKSAVIESESEMPLSVGGSSQIGVDVFDGFDYVALGHLHAPQAIEKETIRYSGSLLKYSLDEAFHKKSMCVVDIKEKENIHISTIPLLPLRDVRVIKGYFLDIITSSEPSNDYIGVELLDETMVFDAMERIRSVYPNALAINYTNNKQSETIALNNIHLEQVKDPLTIFTDFYKSSIGQEPTDEMMDVFKDVIESAKDKANETY